VRNTITRNIELAQDQRSEVSERTAEWILVLTTVFWAGTFVFTKTALQNCDPFLFVGIRFAIAVGICVILWPGMFRVWDAAIARDGALIGVCYGFGFVFQTWGLQYTTISKSAFITGMVVVFVPAVDWFIRKVRVTGVQVLTVVVATVGLILLTNPDGGVLNIGDGMTLAGSLMWAICISSLVQFAVTCVLGLGAYGFVMYFSLNSQLAEYALQGTTTLNPTTWSIAVIIALLYTSIFGSFASTTLQTRFQRFVSPVKAGVIFTLEPVIASFIAYFTHAERMGARELSGAILMIGAVVLGDILKDKKISK
jgi:drug/metabolite transporter (DMT)-like permease